MPDAMDEEPAKDAPSLELPSLGWRRKRRRTEPADAEPTTTVTEPAAPVEPEPTLTTPIEVVPAPPARGPGAAPAPRPEPVLDLDPEPEPEPEPEPRPRRERGPGGMAAAVLTGLVVGLGVVGLTWASLRLCEEVQGTSSCGDTGYGLLIAIMAAMIVVGALLLRLLRVPEPGSTSFLGVGLTAALALVFLVDSLMDRPMVVVIPLLTAGTFAVAHWVTRTFAGPERG